MTNYSQANRPMRIDTALGGDVLLLEAFAGDEWVSAPFSFTLELLSENNAIDAQSLLGTPAHVTIELPGDQQQERVIHGIICRFAQLGQRADLTAYRAQLVPWLWFLSLSTDCKIFQNQTVLEIVEDVFKARQRRDFDNQCQGSYPAREYCVQYRETHFNFVSRLLEEEGILYFFEHSKQKHVLTLANPLTQVQPCLGPSQVRMAAQEGAWQSEDVVLGLQREHAVTADKVTLRDYDYLQAAAQLEQSEGRGTVEIYEFPGEFSHPDEGGRRARLLIEAQEALRHVVRGDSTCRAFQPGRSFDLTEHYRADANQTYRLLHVHHSASGGGYLAGEGTFSYHNSFLAIPKSVPYRPLRGARKPTMHGSQTAVVVGKSGEEIWTDDLGRVNIKFHWDRDHRNNPEDSSCKVRVATNWAGKSWGFVQIPRIGEEVIVDFLEGDPDRPIITGRVYNSDRKPPYTLPANQTQSGIKSRSSKNGTGDNFNEIRFEDNKGSEQIVIHAEKDMQVDVENDRSESVGHDETVKIGNDRTESVGNDESIKIDKNRTESVGGDEDVTVKGNRSLSVSKNETISITGNRDEKIAKDLTEEVGGGMSLKVGKDSTVDVGKNQTLEVGKQITIKAGDSITIQSDKEVLIKTGDASIHMKSNGDIVIKGGKIQVKGSKDLVLKGSKIAAN